MTVDQLPPSLLFFSSRLKYLSSYLMDCQEIRFRHSGSPAVNFLLRMKINTQRRGSCFTAGKSAGGKKRGVQYHMRSIPLLYWNEVNGPRRKRKLSNASYQKVLLLLSQAVKVPFFYCLITDMKHCSSNQPQKKRKKSSTLAANQPQNLVSRGPQQSPTSLKQEALTKRKRVGP